MSDIKECFRSSWRCGKLLEADFSQLEVVGLAILSGDEVLKDDILSGRDMHRVRASELFGVPESEVSSHQRTLAKRLSFQLQYGAGAKSMALKNGIALELAKRFILQYYNRYRGVEQWQKAVMEEVRESRTSTGKHTTLGYPQGKGTHVSDTGRIYTFFEYDAADWAHSKDPTFSPTEIKNYPVQGFATADVMAVYRGSLYRRMTESSMIDDALPINTVHDSVMFDVRNDEVLQELVVVLHDEAAKLPERVQASFGIVCDIPFKIECKAGPTWATMKKID